jgi:YVTN family beta-propeller protein
MSSPSQAPEIFSRELLKLSRKLFNAALVVSVVAACLASAASEARAQLLQFRNFEGPQVHPLALTPDGTRLLAVNTPNGTLSVFQLTSGSPVLTAEIPVGLEPVSVAARNDREAWVVNWLSDSVSVVDLATGNVVRTIGVGDEPTDVLFAGSRAFVCVSGAGVVQVFDASNTAAGSQSVTVFGKQPRSLARDASGSRVFVSVFESGSQTTIVPEPSVKAGGGLPPPSIPVTAPSPAPSTGLIVKWDGSDWRDEIGRSWNAAVPYTLADVDVVAIDAAAQTPSVVAQARGVGTHNGNMAFDPAGSRLYVVNLESTNQVRFEPVLSGRFQQSRVSVLDASAPNSLSLTAARDLDPHVDLSGPGSDSERALSLALPTDIARASDGTLYVTATSSGRVGVLDASGAVQARINVGPGPTGLALDESRKRLYVLDRFDQTLRSFDTDARAQVAQTSIGPDPEPSDVRAGRRIFFDASLSRHGTVSCASCHPGGHRDGLAWDLGDPQGLVVGTPQFSLSGFHPMKGPMVTQSLRGIIGTEPLHWRGDRKTLAEFNPTFVALLGGSRELNAQELSDFTAFIRSLSYPPNPLEALDRDMDSAEREGFDTFRSRPTFKNIAQCSFCHSVTPAGTVGGRSFTRGTGSGFLQDGATIGQPQDFKIVQLRGLYQKGGFSRTPGEKITGFGFMHDGSVASVFDFLKRDIFVFPDDPFSGGVTGDQRRRDIEKFLLQFDTGVAPTVGLQATVRGDGVVPSNVGTLITQAAALDCDLVVRGVYGGRPRAFLRLSDGTFQPDSASEAPVTSAALIAAASESGSELTFTGVLPGTGRRASIDVDGDNVLNDDEGPRASVTLNGRAVDAAGHPLAGVKVTLSGSQSAATTTDASGRFAFTRVSTAGTHTLTPESAGVTFRPQSQTFAAPKSDQSAVFITSPTANASDSSEFFVRQHYNDFLSREPDAAGLAFWVNEIESCGASQQCREVRRINVSGAFFLSIEFQQSGYNVYKTYKASFGNLAGKPVPLILDQLMLDAQRIARGVVVGQGAWQTLIETNKRAFFQGWVQRPEFLARYPAGMSALDFVDTLNANTGGALSGQEHDAIVNQLASNNNTQGRAMALRQVVENDEFTRREKNRAFVLMQYFGYLRRNPNDPPQANLDFEGYSFWLKKLNDFDGNFVAAEMVKAFITAPEYRGRFGQQ